MSSTRGKVTNKISSQYKNEAPAYILGRLAKDLNKKGKNVLDATMGDICVDPDEVSYLQSHHIITTEEAGRLLLFTPKALAKIQRTADRIAEDYSINPLRYYRDFTGIKPLKEQWARWLFYIYHIKFDPNEIICTNGGMGALSLAIETLRVHLSNETNIEVACPMVDWDPHWFQAEQWFGKVQKVPVRSEDDFRLSAHLLDNFLSSHPGIKILYFTNPVNPTGSVYSKKEILDILNVAGKHKLYLIADEVYAMTIYSGLNSFYGLISMGQDKNRILTIQSVSKAFASPGRRGGCLVVKNRKILDQIKLLKEKNELGLNVYAMLECAALMKMVSLPSIEAVKRLFNLRTSLAVKRIEEINNLHDKRLVKRMIYPRHSFYICLQLAENQNVLSFLEKTGIVGVPCGGFGLSDRWLRLAFGCVTYQQIEKLSK